MGKFIICYVVIFNLQMGGMMMVFKVDFEILVWVCEGEKISFIVDCVDGVLIVILLEEKC